MFRSAGETRVTIFSMPEAQRRRISSYHGGPGLPSASLPSALAAISGVGAAPSPGGELAAALAMPRVVMESPALSASGILRCILLCTIQAQRSTLSHLTSFGPSSSLPSSLGALGVGAATVGGMPAASEPESVSPVVVRGAGWEAGVSLWASPVGSVEAGAEVDMVPLAGSVGTSPVMAVDPEDLPSRSVGFWDNVAIIYCSVAYRDEVQSPDGATLSVVSTDVAVGGMVGCVGSLSHATLC